MNDVAWAAGLFEGEGCISLARHYRDNGIHIYPVLVLSMVDKDVVTRFQRVVRCGAIYRTPQRGIGTKDVWRWQLNRRDKVEEVIFMFWDYLGERRQARAIELGIEP